CNSLFIFVGMVETAQHIPDSIKHLLVSQIPTYFENRNVSTNYVTCSVLSGDKILLRSESPSNKVSMMLFQVDIEIEQDKIHLENGKEGKKTEKEALLVKKILNSTSKNDMQDIKYLFSIECRMFKDIIPFILSMSGTCRCGMNCCTTNICKVTSLFQKCYFASGKSKHGVIVLENIQEKGYELCTNRSMLLDYDHLILVLKALARFHALSYAAKKKDSMAFYSKITRKMKKGKTFVTKNKKAEQLYAHGYFQSLQYAAIQPVEEFAKRELNARQYLGIQRLNNLLEDTVELIRQSLRPSEPLSVICHGNLMFTNIYFKYDSNNNPVAVKLTDFQNAHYASPATDLAVFLFLNSSPELRAVHWDQLFSTYHATLVNALAEFLECSRQEILSEFSLSNLKHEFSKHAVYGYVLTSGYVISDSLKCDELFDIFRNDLPSRDDIDKYIVENLKMEGEIVTSRLLPLVKELIDGEFLSDSLETFKV
ncbi:hypothetical protein L9F63_010513, partial [Diploptera punctata]